MLASVWAGQWVVSVYIAVLWLPVSCLGAWLSLWPLQQMGVLC